MRKGRWSLDCEGKEVGRESRVPEKTRMVQNSSLKKGDGETVQPG
mgnify:CR=1 FL=1